MHPQKNILKIKQLPVCYFRCYTTSNYTWLAMLKVLSITILMLFLSGCYVTRLAYKQVSLLATRKNIDYVIAQEKTPPNVRKKLILTKDIIAFAEEEGLNTDDAYNTYIKIDGDSISYTVFAAYTDRLELLKWWYPVVGEVPYRGYFSTKERDAEAKKLANAGYDIHTSNVDAFSSLGWFSDPIYSTMLQRSVWSLADLIFHELTHRTYWIQNNSEFNESIAEYVAYRLTVEFLQAPPTITTKNYKNTTITGKIVKNLSLGCISYEMTYRPFIKETMMTYSNARSKYSLTHLLTNLPLLT